MCAMPLVPRPHCIAVLFPPLTPPPLHMPSLVIPMRLPTCNCHGVGEVAELDLVHEGEALAWVHDAQRAVRARRDNHAACCPPACSRAACMGSQGAVAGPWSGTSRGAALAYVTWIRKAVQHWKLVRSAGREALARCTCKSPEEQARTCTDVPKRSSANFIHMELHLGRAGALPRVPHTQAAVLRACILAYVCLGFCIATGPWHHHPCLAGPEATRRTTPEPYKHNPVVQCLPALLMRSSLHRSRPHN